MKFEWIEEGDGRYRVQFFDMDEKKVFDIKITDYQTWNGRFVANAAMTLSSMPDTARATLTTRITKRNTVFRVNQNMT